MRSSSPATIFPDILPWLRLEGERVRVSQVSPTADSVPTPCPRSQNALPTGPVSCASVGSTPSAGR